MNFQDATATELLRAFQSRARIPDHITCGYFAAIALSDACALPFLDMTQYGLLACTACNSTTCEHCICATCGQEICEHFFFPKCITPALAIALKNSSLQGAPITIRNP